MTYQVEIVEAVVHEQRFLDVRCDEYDVLFKDHALGDAGVDEQGRWISLQPEGGLTVQLPSAMVRTSTAPAHRSACCCAGRARIG